MGAPDPAQEAPYKYKTDGIYANNPRRVLVKVLFDDFRQFPKILSGAKLLVKVLFRESF